MSSSYWYYRDFDLKLSAKRGVPERSPWVEVIGLPGEACAEKLELPEESFTGHLERFKEGKADRQSSAWLGSLLFDALLPLSIREHWRRYQDFMLADSVLRMRLDTRHRGLAIIPWEIVHDGGSPLVMSPRQPIVRGRPRRRRQIPMRDDACLRILFVAHDPDQPGPSADQEARLVRDSMRPLAQAGAVKVEVLESPSKTDLELRLKGSDVLHYVGRGVFSRGAAKIVLGDAALGGQLVSGKELAGMLDRASVRLLILNAAGNATRTQMDALMTVAHSALWAGFPAIVAMQGVMAAGRAAEFASTFYRGLASGEQLETCVIEGRRAVAAGRPDRADWAMPVLCTDLPDGILWGQASRARPHRRSEQPVAGRSAGALDQPRPATVTVRSSDELAALELADSTGRRLSAAQGNLVATNLSPGFYRARLLTPESAVVEELIDLEEGENRDIRLAAPTGTPSRLARMMMAKAGFAPDSDGYLNVSGTVGLVAGAEVTTLLTLAAQAVNTQRPWGDRLLNLGLRSYQDLAGADAGSGLQLILAIEASTGREAVRRLSATSVRFWRELDPIPEPHGQLQLIELADGIAEFAVEGRPGRYWLSLQVPGSDPLVFVAVLLPGRLTMFIVQEDESGETNILAYMPSLAGDENVEPASAGEHPSTVMLRRLELMQRFSMSGHLDHALMNARELLLAGWEEPIAAALGGYLMLRSNNFGEFLTASGGLMSRFGELSDSHVLVATALANTGVDDHRVEREFRAALDQGLPIVRDGLGMLAEGVDRYGIEHPRVPLLSAVFHSHVPGMLWSAWRPQALTAGTMLTAS